MISIEHAINLKIKDISTHRAVLCAVPCQTHRRTQCAPLYNATRCTECRVSSPSVYLQADRRLHIVVHTVGSSTEGSLPCSAQKVPIG